MTNDGRMRPLGQLGSRLKPIGIGVMLVAAVVAFWFALLAPSPPMSEKWDIREGRVQPPLFVLPDSLNFGRSFVNSAFRWPILVQNRSSMSIRVSDFISDCTCVNVEPKASIFAPGEVKQMFLTLDTTGPYRDSEMNDLAEYSTRFALVDDIQRPLSQVATLQGYITSPVEISPKKLAFVGSHSIVIGKTCKPQIVTVKEREPLKDLQLRYDRLKVSAEWLASKDVSTHLLSVAPLPGSNVGRFDEPVQIDVVTMAGSIANLTFGIAGDIVNDVQATPPIVNFPPSRSTATPVKITLRSRSGTKFHISKTAWTPKVEGSFKVASNMSSYDEVNYEFVLSVVQPPMTEGIHSGELEFAIEENRESQVDHSEGMARYRVHIPVVCVVGGT
jgi:hypothetical protein